MSWTMSSRPTNICWEEFFKQFYMLSLAFIKVIDLHYRHNVNLLRKRSNSFALLPKRTCAHLELNET